MNGGHQDYRPIQLGWVSEIPAHWDIARTKDLFVLEKRPVRDGDGIVTAFRDGQVTLRTKRRPDGFTNAIAEAGYQGIRKGDLVIHNMDAFAGAIGISDSDGKSTPVYSVCSAKEGVHSQYFSALMRHIAVSGYIESLSRGIRERSSDFRWADSGGLHLPVPPRDEQIAIASFLDHETGKIDYLISEQEQLIALLNEKRQAVVSHAVTKGLNPDVKMKDSGIEWLGEVPAHWTVKKLKLTASSPLRNGLGESSDKDDPKDPRYIRITDINGSRSLRSDTFRSLPADIASAAPVRKHDILLAAVGATFGKSYLHIEDFQACYAGYLVRYAPGVETDPSFISHWTESSAYWNQLKSRVIQSTIQNFSASKYGDLNIVMPPASEQAIISERLDGEVAKIQDLQEQATLAMGYLKERRSALISAAVTGKIDVRNHPAAIAALNENKDS